MALKTLQLKFGGKIYVKTFSTLPDHGVMREGIIYYDAIDPSEFHREYTEVKLPDDMIPKEEEPKQEEESEQMVQ